jgi:hypothetical protein
LRIGVKRRRVSAWTRREVVEKLDALRALTESGQPLGKEIRVGEWFDWYIDFVVAHKSANTPASYKWAFKQCSPLRGSGRFSRGSYAANEWKTLQRTFT